MRIDQNISSSDETQLTLYRNSGDPEILGALYEKYMHLVYGLCLKYLKNREDAQDAVMAIYEHISVKLLDSDVTYFKSWLYMVSKNHCLMILRKSKPEFYGEVIMESDLMMHPNDSDQQLEHDLQTLEKCIEELNPEQKKCVELFFLKKNSYQQISETSGLEIKKVKSHIQNGKRNLKLCMESKNVRE